MRIFCCSTEAKCFRLMGAVTKDVKAIGLDGSLSRTFLCPVSSICCVIMCHEATFLLSQFLIDAIVFFVDAVVEEEKVERA